jgi:glycoprotein-N-acetylgalactosamine 3-beta-galactosyltransferase
VNVANCLFQSAGILPYDTRDNLKRERFHPFTPGQHLEYRAPPDGNDWYVQYNPELKFGYECCSDKSVSFHYAKVILNRPPPNLPLP